MKTFINNKKIWVLWKILPHFNIFFFSIGNNKQKKNGQDFPQNPYFYKNNFLKKIRFFSFQVIVCKTRNKLYINIYEFCTQ